MNNPTGFGVALLATASFAFAGGEGDKKGGDKTAAKKTLTVLKDGWSGGPGQGLTYSSDAFSIKLLSGAQIQFSYVDNDAVADTSGFDVRRTRTILSGHLWNKNIRYRLQNEWRENASVKDAYVDWGFYNTDNYNMGVRVGQMKTAFGRDWNTPFYNLQFIDRSLATRTFTGERTRTAILYGTAQGGKLGWSAGVSNGEMAFAAVNAGEEGDPRAFGPNDDADNEINYTFEAHWTSNPGAVNLRSAQADLGGENSGGYGFGGSYFFGNGRHTFPPVGGAATDVETGSLNLWGAWKSGKGIAVSGEYFFRMEESDGAGSVDADSDGYYVAATWTAAPIEDQAQMGFGVRYAFISSDDNQHLLSGILAGADNEAQQLDLVFNLFHYGHALKNQIAASWIATEVPPPGNQKTDTYMVSWQSTFLF